MHTVVHNAAAPQPNRGNDSRIASERTRINEKIKTIRVRFYP